MNRVAERIDRIAVVMNLFGAENFLAPYPMYPWERIGVRVISNVELRDSQHLMRFALEITLTTRAGTK